VDLRRPEERHARSIRHAGRRSIEARLAHDDAEREPFLGIYPPGSKEFFQEARANEFMGSLLTPRRLLSRQFAARCEAMGLRPADFIGRGDRCLLAAAQRPPDGAVSSEGNLSFLNLDLRFRLQQVILLLARDFGVTRRFIEVRLNKYELLSQSVAG
jgi:hypothetical protein